MQSVKVTKSFGAVFIDCDKCNPNCPLQQQVNKNPKVVIQKPFSGIKEHMIKTRNLLAGADKIAQNAQDFYEIACKICYNCTEKQR